MGTVLHAVFVFGSLQDEGNIEDEEEMEEEVWLSYTIKRSVYVFVSSLRRGHYTRTA